MKKKIILAITRDVKLYECFIDNLNKLGFEVLLLCDNKPFKYRKKTHKVLNFFRKTFLKDKLYKKELQKLYTISDYLEILNNTPNDYDYALFVRPDLFNDNIIQLVKEKAATIYAYQWDGLSRFPNVHKTIPFFKKFYVFDKDDLLENKNVHLLNNFYFDCYTNVPNQKEPEYDVYFVVSYDSRIERILNICEQLHSLGLKLNINISCPKSEIERLKKYPYITIVGDSLSYKDNLTNVENAKIVLDIVHSTLHKGLSLRPFEALGYNKKLITTNSSIKDYDFYNPNNTLVYDENSSQEDLIKDLLDFIKKDYTPVKQEIKNNYSFTNWINHVLEQDL